MTSFDASIDALPAVDLDELRRTAPLLTRRDRKYVVPIDRLPPIVEGLPGRADVLDIGGRRAFSYESVYFDTPDRASYLDAARRRPRRWKVRRRTYHDSGERFVEVKLRDRRGITIKHRLPTAGLDDHLAVDERAFVDSFEVADGAVLEPALITRYRRTTLLLTDLGARVSIDRAIRFADAAEPHGACELVDVAIVEVKSSERVTFADRRLWQLGHRPTPISKYGTGLATLHRDLPSNRWHRTLGRLAS